MGITMSKNRGGQDDYDRDPRKVFITDMRMRINAYFQLVVRNIKDSIPKIIGHFLVRKVQNNIKFELSNGVNNSETIMNLLSERTHPTGARNADADIGGPRERPKSDQEGS